LYSVSSRGECRGLLAVTDRKINLGIIYDKTSIGGFLSGFCTNGGIAGVIIFPSVLSIPDGIRDDLILLNVDADIE
jgi:hypothetical protein